jgi:hypothetical protein
MLRNAIAACWRSRSADMPHGKKCGRSRAQHSRTIIAAVVASVASANLVPAVAQKRPGPEGALISVEFKTIKRPGKFKRPGKRGGKKGAVSCAAGVHCPSARHPR